MQAADATRCRAIRSRPGRWHVDLCPHRWHERDRDRGGGGLQTASDDVVITVSADATVGGRTRPSPTARCCARAWGCLPGGGIVSGGSSWARREDRRGGDRFRDPALRDIDASRIAAFTILRVAASGPYPIGTTDGHGTGCRRPDRRQRRYLSSDRFEGAASKVASSVYKRSDCTGAGRTSDVIAAIEQCG